MAEAANNPPAPLPTAEEVAAHNQAIKDKLVGQNQDPRPDPVAQQHTGDALDSLLKAAEEKKKAAGDEPPEQPVVDKKEEKPGAPAAEPKAADPADKAAAEAAAAKAAEEKAARDAELKKADDVFKDAPGLPSGASPKSHEAFSSIKIKAAQEISRLTSELEKASKALAEQRETSGKPSAETEQLKKEAEELRKWRAKLDIEFDPKFKEFDTAAAQAREFVYSQLRKGNISDATIEKIKQLGGPDKVRMAPILEALGDPTAQRLIESKLADVEMAKYNKEQAIASTKTNIDQYMASRQEELSKVATQHIAETTKELDNMWGALDWTKPVSAKQGATAEEKQQVENHNKFVTGMRQELDAAVKEMDSNPKIRATLLTGVAQLFNLQNLHQTLKAKFEVLEKEAADLRSFKDKVKGASRSRFPESQAPASGSPSVQKPTNIFNTNASDAVDALAKQVMAERAAKGQ